MIIHDGKTDMTNIEKTPNPTGTSYGGFASMLEYEAYQRKKAQTGRKTVLLTSLLALVFILFVGTLLFIFIYQAMQARDNGNDPSDENAALASRDEDESDTNPDSDEALSVQTQPVRKSTDQTQGTETADETTADTEGGTDSSAVGAYDLSQYIDGNNLTVDDEDSVNSICRIGITCVNITEKEAELYRVPKGVLVYTISSESSAFQNGLLKGDIIESFDGIRIYTMCDLITRKQMHCPGDVVSLTVYRGDREYTVSFALDPVSEG